MKLTKTTLKQIIREETERAIKEGQTVDYEEALELELKRARRDGLRGKEAYEWAKKNLRSSGIHPPKNKPALGKDTESLKEVERDLPDLEDLDERLETLINNLDRARIARNYIQLRELLAQATAFDMEIANIQTLITT